MTHRAAFQSKILLVVCFIFSPTVLHSACFKLHSHVREVTPREQLSPAPKKRCSLAVILTVTFSWTGVIALMLFGSPRFQSTQPGLITPLPATNSSDTGQLNNTGIIHRFDFTASAQSLNFSLDGNGTHTD